MYEEAWDCSRVHIFPERSITRRKERDIDLLPDTLVHWIGCPWKWFHLRYSKVARISIPLATALLGAAAMCGGFSEGDPLGCCGHGEY